MIVVLFAGSGPLNRMPKETRGGPVRVVSVSPNTIHRARGLHPDVCILMDWLPPEMYEELQPWRVDNVVDMAE